MSNKLLKLKFREAKFSSLQIFGSLLNCLVFPFAVHCLFLTANAQRIAFLTPDESANSRIVRQNLETTLANEFKIVNDSIAESVPQNFSDQNIFNLSAGDAQNFGKALGCDFFVLLKAETLRRSTSAKPGFYIESYAVIYLVSSRTGQLVLWKMQNFQSPTAAESEKKLTASLENLAREISEKINSTNEKAQRENLSPALEELPPENSPAAENFRPPLPYHRLKPEYTTLASIYGVTATVDASVELDDQGTVQRVEIVRWAGYGLDESVEAAIRKMHWRAAERGGKFLPIRVLLRYNFKEIDHDKE